MQKVKKNISERKNRLVQSFEDYKKHRAEQIVLKGNGRFFAVAGYALFYFVDRVMDFLLPMLAVPLILGITLNLAVLIPVGVVLGVFVALLTLNATMNYLKDLDKIKADIDTIEEDNRKLADIDFQIIQLYDEIEKLEKKLNDPIANISARASVANANMVAQQAISEESKFINHKFVDKILKRIHSAMMQGMNAIKEAKDKFNSFMSVKDLAENFMALYGFVKLLLLSIGLIFVLPPVLVLLAVVKVLFINSVEQLKQETIAARAKYPELLSNAQDMLALVTREKELLEFKLQAKEKVMTQQPVLFVQQGRLLSDNVKPQQGKAIASQKAIDLDLPKITIEPTKEFTLNDEACGSFADLGLVIKMFAS